MILTSLILPICYIVVYNLFSNLINKAFYLGNLLNLNFINLVLIFVFFYSLHLFISAAVYVAMSFRE